MVETADQDGLRSVFLMEAWDTLAALEAGIGRIAAGEEPGWDELVLITHRLQGAATLHGFTRLAELVDVVAQVLRPLPQATLSARRARAVDLTALMKTLTSVLDAIANPPDTPAASPTSAGAPAPADLAHDPVRQELLGFFAEGDEVLAYFIPEAAEHLEAMTGALLALEREGTGEGELAALFRAVHTLKGAAYVVGCIPVGELAHGLEDVLVALRARRAPVTPAVIDAGLAAVDVFKLMLDPAADATRDLTAAAADIRARIAGVLAEPVSVPADAAPAGTSRDSAPPRPARSRGPAVPRGRQTIRVPLERLDGLMDVVGELVVARSALERRLGDLDRLADALFSSRARLGQAVTDFERQHLEARLPASRHTSPSTEGSPAESRLVAEQLAELEFNRHDDVARLARSVAEIASDIAEVQAEIAGLGRTVREGLGLVHRLTGDVRAGLGRARLVPIGTLYTRFVRQGQEAARRAGKSVRIETSGESVELDAGIIEQIVDPLLHLVQNAVVHGLESRDEREARGKPVAGTVTLSASHRGAFVVVEVADDGQGIDTARLREQAVAQGFVRAEVADVLTEREALDLIFLPGFSTATQVTPAAGRGVGMDIVRTNVGRLNGEIDVDTLVGAGTRFTLRLPLTVLVTEALLVRVGPALLAVPLNAVHVIATLGPQARRREPDGETALVEGRWLPLVRLDRALGLPAPAMDGQPSLVLRGGAGLFACPVTEVVHKEEVVVKPLGAFLDGIGPYAGATVSPDGRVTVLLDPVRLGELALHPPPDRVEQALAPSPAVEVHQAEVGREGPHQGLAALRKGKVLLVDDSISVRTFVGQMLEKAGFEVITAGDGAEALARLDKREFAVMVTDLEMPRLNGYELLEEVRRRPATRALPIVVLTTRAGVKHESLARRLGISHYLTKPVTEDMFVRVVESLALPDGAEARP